MKTSSPFRQNPPLLKRLSLRLPTLAIVLLASLQVSSQSTDPTPLIGTGDLVPGTRSVKVPINVKGTYLPVGPDDPAAPPSRYSLRLSDNPQFTAGDRVVFRLSGTVQVAIVDNEPVFNNTLTARFINASGQTIAPAPGSSYSEVVSMYSCWPTLPRNLDIPNDFNINYWHDDELNVGGAVIIPADAVEIQFSVHDCFFADNVTPDNFSTYIEMRKLEPAAAIPHAQARPDNCHCGEAYVPQSSTVRVDSQTLEEVVPIPKTGQSLHYSTAMQSGYRTPYRIKIPILGNLVPNGLTRVNLKIEIANEVRLSTNLLPSSGLSYTYDWNGLSLNGQAMPAEQQAVVTLSHFYSDSPNEARFVDSYPMLVGTNLADHVGLGGWTLSSHHRYDVLGQRLYTGDGNRILIPPRKTQPQIEVPSQDGAQVFVFDSNGRHLQTRNGKSNAVLLSFAYDSSGRLIGITDAFGNQTRILHNTSSFQIVGPYGHSTSGSMSGGRLTRIEPPSGGAYSMSYHASGLLASFQKPNGGQTQFIYDSLGRITRDDAPLGRSLNLSREGELLDAPIVSVTTNGRTSRQALDRDDEQNYVRVETLPHGESLRHVTSNNKQEVVVGDGTRTTTFMRDDLHHGKGARFPYRTDTRLPSGLTKSVFNNQEVFFDNPNDPSTLIIERNFTTINGKTSRADYDNRNASSPLLTTTSPMGRITSTRFDQFGRVVEKSAPDLLAIFNEYDNRGRLIRTTQGTRVTHYRYNELGDLTEVEDPLGRVTQMQYDGAGRKIASISPALHRTDTEYDLNSNITVIRPPGRSEHRFLFDALDRVVKMLAPDLLSRPDSLNSFNETMIYNEENEMTQKKRMNANLIDWVYDQTKGLLTRISTSRGDYQFSYLPNLSKVDFMTSPDQVRTDYRYDGALVVEEARSGQAHGSIRWSFDNEFRVIRSQALDRDLNSPPFADIGFNYNPDSQLISAGDMSLEYRSSNGQLLRTIKDRVTDERTYNGYGEVTHYEAKLDGDSLLYSYSLIRDQAGRITRKTENIGGEVFVSDYGYDLAGRLITVHEDSVLVSSFTFDQNGNRTTIQDRSASFAATTDAQDRLVTYGSLSFQYQDSGEVALRTDTSTGESASFTYDDRGNLRAAALPGQCNLSYKADAKDRRVTKSYNGQLEEQYLYEDQLRITARLNADGEITQRYVYATLAHSPDLIRSADAEYRVLHDHLGSPRVIVNTQSGEIVRVMRHDAWGRILADTNPGFSPHGFAGGLADQDTKLVRFGARDYSPELGRWVARDPIGFEGGDANLYGYVMQDPVNGVDPSGLAAPAVIPLIPIVLPAVTEAATFALAAIGISIICKGDTSPKRRTCQDIWELGNLDCLNRYPNNEEEFGNCLKPITAEYKACIERANAR